MEEVEDLFRFRGRKLCVLRLLEISISLLRRCSKTCSLVSVVVEVGRELVATGVDVVDVLTLPGVPSFDAAAEGSEVRCSNVTRGPRRTLRVEGGARRGDFPCDNAEKTVFGRVMTGMFLVIMRGLVGASGARSPCLV